MKFNYYLPSNLIFGRGRINEVGIEASKYGKKALVVTMENIAQNTNFLEKTIGLLKEAGVEAVVFDQVEPNPLTTTAYRGAEAVKKNSCDVVIGLGGGSIMDAAKSIAFIAANEGDISDYIFGKKVSDAALPIILIPTTCGTGSEGNCFAVLSNPETNDKKSLRCNAIIAKASIIDPELMVTMPKHITASVGFDALCHNMEAYISKIGQPMTDMMAREGIKLIAENLPKIYEDPADMEAWENVTWGSTLGGMVINTAGVTAPHGMEHPASGLRNIVHGVGLAALTPLIYEESICGAPEKFAEISRLLGGKDQNDCVDRINLLLEKLNLVVTLGEQGIKEEDVDWMVENCMKVSAAGIQNHPVVFDQKDLKRIYEKAL